MTVKRGLQLRGKEIKSKCSTECRPEENEIIVHFKVLHNESFVTYIIYIYLYIM